MIRSKQKRGFTLIEVTLAIVIGIIMIAGATLIYNQAKTSAGNSRAQAKVVALQQLVEEYAAQNQGIYPDRLNDVNALWTRKRPDDWNKSPWGGLIGSSFTAAAWNGGVVNNSNGTAMNFSAAASTSAATHGNNVAANTTGVQGLVGGLVYDYDGANGTWTYAADIMTNSSVAVKGYAVYICDQQGRFPNFVVGGKVNQ